MRAPLAACRELALDYNTFPKLIHVFEQKIIYFNPCFILTHALYTRIVVFWHTSNMPIMIP